MELRERKSLSGSITVYLALSFVLIAALILTIVESARSVSERLYVQVALDASMENLFSQYHRPLWENYRLLGLQYRTDSDLKKELCEFIKPYQNAHNLFPMQVTKDQVSFSEHVHLTDRDAFEESVLEYMKYGMIDSLLSFGGRDYDESSLLEEATHITERASESKEIREIQKQYQLDASDLEDVEDAIAKIHSLAENAASIHQDGASALSDYDAYSFYGASDHFQSELTKLKAQVPIYTKAAEKLAAKVQTLRTDFSARSATLSPEACAAIESEITEYERYIDADGPIRKEIEAMPAKADTLIQQAEDMEQAVSDFEDWLEEAIEEAEDDEDEDDYDFDDEIEDFYDDALSDWNHMSLIHYSGTVSTINKQNKRLLDQIAGMTNRDILSLVLPDRAELPSRDAIHNRKPGFSADSTAHPAEIVLLGEYAFKYFNYYHLKELREQSKPPSGSTALEMEYLLNGKESDYDNLSAFILELVAFREASNLIYLYMDAQKRTEAMTFVSSFLVTAANPLLLSVLTFFVLSIWALGQAIIDVRHLLANERVPLMHDNTTWSMKVSELLVLGRGHMPDDNAHEQRGLSYRDYLRGFLILLGLKDQATVNRRMLSTIERNLKSIGEEPETGFSLEKCIYSLRGSVPVSADHVMYHLGILHMVASNVPESQYTIALSSDYSYRNKVQ